MSTEANPVELENRRPGTDAWELGHAGFQTADDLRRQIKGYASATSVNKGESITLHVSVNPPQTYTVDVYRMGWYGGLGGRLLHRVDSLPGVHQPDGRIDPDTGLRECGWSAGYTMTVPPDWVSGVYVALLTNASGYQNYIVFVVRDDHRNADLLFQSSVLTYQAYNNYPNDGETGKSLYGFNSWGSTVPDAVTSEAVPGPRFNRRAVKVSFDRPYRDEGAGELFQWEIYFVRWLERSGYDVSYSTDVDTHAGGSRLLDHKGFISVGHNEYWSKEMYDAAVAARDRGLNIGFFGANAVYWQTRLEPSSTGVPNRVMVLYRRAHLDPVQGPTTTVQWRHSILGRPEQALIGVMFARSPVDVPYVVVNSSNWVYAGTGFQDGDSVPHLVGYEFDCFHPRHEGPENLSYTMLSRSPVTINGQSFFAESSIYQAPSGAWVFGAGTIWWSWGLDKPAVADSRIQRATTNLLDRFVAVPPPGSSTAAVRETPGNVNSRP